MQRSLSGSIALTRLNHYILNVKGKNGKKVKGIFIPVDEHDKNYLVKGKDDTYYASVRVIVKDEADQYGQHGFISHVVDSKTYKDASEEQKEEFKKLKILGNIKDFEAAANDGHMGTQNLEHDPDSDDDNDLPF